MSSGEHELADNKIMLFLGTCRILRIVEPSLELLHLSLDLVIKYSGWSDTRDISITPSAVLEQLVSFRR